GNNVARVFSYGSINASVSARNDSGSSQGGRIGQVDALGDISGSIHAKQLLAEVRAGGVINASLDAPSLGNISSHDATIAAQNPVPDTPPSSTASVVAQAMEARRDVVAARDELRDLLTEAFTAIEAARTDAASAASRERSGMVIEARRLRAEATEQLIGDRSAREFSLAAQRIQAAFADLQGAAAADRLRAVLATTWKMRESAGDEAFRRSRDEATRFQAKETEARDKMRQSATEARDKFRESADEFQDVMKAVIKGIKEKIAAAVDIPAMFSGMSEGMKKSIHETEALADELGYRDEERGDFIVSNLIVQWFPGLRKIYAGMWGEDPYTLTKLTRFQQIFSFVTGVLDAIEFIETVYAAGKMLYSRFTSPCGSWFGGTCFVGDTLVLCGTDVASDLYFASDTESFWDRVIPLPDWLQFACVTIGGAGVVVLTRRGRREEIREQDEFSPNNGGAGEAPFEEWDPNICPPPRRKSPVPGQDSGSRVWTTGSIILLGRSLENAGPPMQNASMSTSQPPLGVDFATCGRAAHFQTVQGENAWGDWSSAARAVCGVLDSGEAGGFVGELIPLQTDHSDFSPTGFGGTCDSTSGGVELPRLPIPRSETIGLRRPTRRPGQSVYWSDTPLEIEAIGGLPLADKGTGESPTGGAVLRPSRMEASDRHFPASKSRTSGIETPAREPEREGEAPAEPLMRQHQLMDADFNQPPQCVSRRGGTESLTNVVMTAVGETHCGCHTASGNRPNQNHPNHRRSTPGDQPSHPWWLGAPLVWLTVWLSLATIVWGFNHDVRKMVRSRPTPAPVA
ncbi:MAG: hypothetical protein NT069_23045, partial [Planctomycetota bacterium]|nr:hypothetical protein [Planctomycetota bacterium]